MPSSSAGNGSGFSQLSFPYYPLYVLDENNGIVLFNGQSQQANENGVVDLYAQVKGATVSTYSWTTSNLNIVSSSGSSTYHFHFQLTGTQTAPAVGSVTLLVTDSNSHQESETFYFVMPTTNVVTLPTSSSWPTTIPPDLVEPGAPMIASQGVAVDADSGALDSDINLPSYNPNHPSHVVDLQLAHGESAANRARAPHARPQPGSPDQGQRDPDIQWQCAHDLLLRHKSVDARRRPADRAPGPTRRRLSTGRYGYSVQIVDYRDQYQHDLRPTPARPRCSTSRRAPSATAGRSRAWSRSSPLLTTAA